MKRIKKSKNGGKVNKKILFLVIIVFMVFNMHGFDGKRKGFLLGFGAGISRVSFVQEVDGYGYSDTSESETKIGFATDFKIGYAPNNSTEICYSRKAAWFTLTNIYEDDVTICDGVGVLSLSFFLSPELKNSDWASSSFFSLGLGFSDWNTPFESNAEAWNGFGFFVGGGYEFAKHFSFGADLFVNNPSINEGGYTFTTRSVAILFTMNALAY
jgi:hypothetical protein